MSLNSTPSGERIHISFFGCRNAGKSSLINALTEQKLSIVSEVPGTTTDPVSKAMELFPLGPCVITDTAGIDDVGELGNMRTESTRKVLDKTDIAVIVIDSETGINEHVKKLIETVKQKEIPYLLCFNKSDKKHIITESENEIAVSARTGEGVEELRIKLGAMQGKEPKRYILRDIVCAGDTVLLVIPIDESAPKGRLILPQQQVIRELLECGCCVMAVRDTELQKAIDDYGSSISLVITDSQAFAHVEKTVPKSIPLTSFSILFMRYKGELNIAVEGAKAIDDLCDGDKVLISEGCTHHRQCNDIGSVKLPTLIERYTGKKLIFEHTQGTEFAEDLSPYKLIIHCGACMLNEKEVKSRIQKAVSVGKAFTNYGIAISCCTGILDRATALFRQA